MAAKKISFTHEVIMSALARLARISAQLTHLVITDMIVMIVIIGLRKISGIRHEN